MGVPGRGTGAGRERLQQAVLQVSGRGLHAAGSRARMRLRTRLAPDREDEVVPVELDNRTAELLADLLDAVETDRRRQERDASRLRRTPWRGGLR